jgi:multidrug efflux pump subunit AcrB
MMEEMGVSVLSGALSTLLAVFLMFFAPNSFFVKFATFLFVTIALSCIYAMTFFPALLSIVGPMGSRGEIYVKLKECRKKMLHEFTKEYIQSKEFIKRETKNPAKTKETSV